MYTTRACNSFVLTALSTNPQPTGRVPLPPPAAGAASASAGCSTERAVCVETRGAPIGIISTQPVPNAYVLTVTDVNQGWRREGNGPFAAPGHFSSPATHRVDADCPCTPALCVAEEAAYQYCSLGPSFPPAGAMQAATQRAPSFSFSPDLPAADQVGSHCCAALTLSPAAALHELARLALDGACPAWSLQQS